MPIHCAICEKNITPRQVDPLHSLEMQSPVSAGSAQALAPNYATRFYYYIKSWYDYFCREGIYTSQQGGHRFYYCSCCASYFNGVIEHVERIHGMFNTGEPVDLDSSFELMVLTTSRRDDYIAVTGDREEETRLSHELNLDSIHFDLARLVNKAMTTYPKSFPDRLYEIAQFKLYPIIFSFMMELSSNLRKLFQIVSNCNCSYLQALKEYNIYDPIEHYNESEFLKQTYDEIVRNYASLRGGYLAKSGGIRFENEFAIFAMLEEYIAKPLGDREGVQYAPEGSVFENIKIILAEIDKADRYRKLVSDQPQAFFTSMDDFTLLPTEYFDALFQRISIYEDVINEVATKAECTEDFVALWIVSPELRLVVANAYNDGLSLDEYFNNLVHQADDLTKADILELILTGTKNFLSILLQKMGASYVDFLKLPVVVRNTMGLDFESFTKIIEQKIPEPVVLNSVLKRTLRVDGESALRGSPQRPQRQQVMDDEVHNEFESVVFWQAYQFDKPQNNFDQSMRNLARISRCSVMYHTLFALSPVLQDYDSKAKQAGVSLQRYIIRLAGWRQRRSGILSSILNDAKKNVVKLKDYAFNKHKNVYMLSILLRHVERVKPEAMENLLFAYDQRRLNVVYRAPVILSLELMLCVLLLISVYYLSSWLYYTFFHHGHLPVNDDNTTTPRPGTTPHPGNHTTPRPITPHPGNHTTPKPITPHPGNHTTPKPITPHPGNHTTPKPIIPKTSTSTTTVNHCAEFPVENSQCSTNAMQHAINLLTWYQKFGVKTVQQLSNLCPNLVVFINVLGAWYADNPEALDKLQTVYQMTMQGFINVLTQYTACK